VTDPTAEVVLEVLGQLQPCRSGDPDPHQDRRQVLGDGPALVVAHRPTGPAWFSPDGCSARSARNAWAALPRSFERLLRVGSR